MVLELAKEAIASIEKNSVKFEELRGISVKDGWNFCSECGYLEPLTNEEIEFYRKEGMPEEVLKIKKHKRFEGRTVPLEKAKAIHSFVDNWMEDLKKKNENMVD